jgi:hypothetical protein
MILLQYSHVTKKETILFSGSLSDVLERYKALTKRYESHGIFMVQEHIKEGTYVSEFATTQRGHLLDLIVCGGITQNVHVNRITIK